MHLVRSLLTILFLWFGCIFGEIHSSNINGFPAVPKQFPHQAGLEFTKNWLIFIEKTRWCSGSVISANWILTTASCCRGMDSVRVTVGSNIRNKGYSVVSSDFIVHENSSSEHRFNDIALIQTTTLPLTENGDIQSIRLPKAIFMDQDLDESPCIFSSWGSSNGEGELLYTKATISFSDTCFMDTNDYVGSILCAFASTSGRQDSGSPLVHYSKDGPMQVGLFNFAFMGRCLFTRLTYHAKWIERKTGGLKK